MSISFEKCFLNAIYLIHMVYTFKLFVTPCGLPYLKEETCSSDTEQEKVIVRGASLHPHDFHTLYKLPELEVCFIFVFFYKMPIQKLCSDHIGKRSYLLNNSYLGGVYTILRIEKGDWH